jgi:colicin import membrane protein
VKRLILLLILMCGNILAQEIDDSKGVNSQTEIDWQAKAFEAQKNLLEADRKILEAEKRVLEAERKTLEAEKAAFEAEKKAFEVEKQLAEKEGTNSGKKAPKQSPRSVADMFRYDNSKKSKKQADKPDAAAESK